MPQEKIMLLAVHWAIRTGLHFRLFYGLRMVTLTGLRHIWQPKGFGNQPGTRNSSSLPNSTWPGISPKLQKQRIVVFDILELLCRMQGIRGLRCT